MTTSRFVWHRVAGICKPEPFGQPHLGESPPDILLPRSHFRHWHESHRTPLLLF